MKLEWFIARRLTYSTGRDQGHRGISRLLSLSVVAVGLSLVVMLLSLAIILGFKREISTLAYSQTGHISLYPAGSSWSTTEAHLAVTPSLIDYIGEHPSVLRVEPVLQATALLKTPEAFRGIPLYGVDSAYQNHFFAGRIVQGQMPSFSDLDSTNAIVLPLSTTRAMNLEQGDRIHLYYLDSDRMRVRSYTLSAIYDDHGIDNMPALCRGAHLRRVFGIAPDQYSRIALYLHDDEHLVSQAEELGVYLSQAQRLLGDRIGLNTADELMPDLFTWLTLLDANVLFLIIIMLIVGAFTMITGLIIIVLDKRRQIGILKALGASQRQIRIAFALVGVRLILRGLGWGNTLALALCLIQAHYRIIKLDPRSYFMDAVPIAFDWSVWLGVNVGTLVFIFVMILAPTYIIASIRPSEALRIE